MTLLARATQQNAILLQLQERAGSATAGVMAAIAFGLAGSTVDNLGANVLYEIDLSPVRAMVNTLQANYSKAIKKAQPTVASGNPETGKAPAVTKAQASEEER